MSRTIHKSMLKTRRLIQQRIKARRVAKAAVQDYPDWDVVFHDARQILRDTEAKRRGSGMNGDALLRFIRSQGVALDRLANTAGRQSRLPKNVASSLGIAAGPLRFLKESPSPVEEWTFIKRAAQQIASAEAQFKRGDFD